MADWIHYGADMGIASANSDHDISFRRQVKKSKECKAKVQSTGDPATIWKDKAEIV